MNGCVKNSLKLSQILVLHAFIFNYFRAIKSQAIIQPCGRLYFFFSPNYCFFRLYGTSGACAVCAKLIPATELVMKVLGKVYHLQCFTCTTCHNQLVSGDRFHVVNGRLFCENDDPNLLKQIHAAKQTVCIF